MTKIHLAPHEIEGGVTYSDSRLASSKMFNLEKEEKDGTNGPWICTFRVALAFLGFLGFANMYALKVNISVAIVCMVNLTESIKANADDPETANLTLGYLKEDCKSDSTSSSSKDSGGEFDWDKSTQGLVLGGFFYGYMSTQVLGGWLASHYGGKRIFGWFMFACALATVLCPFGARIHYGVLVALRVVCGIGQGVVWPAMHSIWSKWAPPKERSTLIGFTFAGSQVGNIISFPVSSLLCEYGFDGGWASIFYIMGGFGILWFILWMVMVSDSPGQHPRITQEEREYIEHSLAGQIKVKSNEKLVIPWKSIFTSLPVWAIIVCHTCANWMTYLFLTMMPTYMKEVLGFDIKANGLLSAVPYIGMWLTIMISAVAADYALSRGHLNITNVRKVSITIGLLLPAIIVIILGFFDCTQSTLAVIVMTLGIALTGCPYGGGYMVNHADVAPRFSSILFGLSNTAATIPGFMAPSVVAALTKNHSREEWQTVFYITSGIVLFGWIFYLIFGSGDLQPWAVSESMGAILEKKKEDEQSLKSDKVRAQDKQDEQPPPAAVASESFEHEPEPYLDQNPDTNQDQPVDPDAPTEAAE